jgi:hypothetical protein
MDRQPRRAALTEPLDAVRQPVAAGAGGRELQCYILPRHQPRDPAPYDRRTFGDEIYAGCYELLDRTFEGHSDFLKAAVRSDASLSPNWAASRAACLVLDGKVVTALTYRTTSHTLHGTAIMVRRRRRCRRRPVLRLRRRCCCWCRLVGWMHAD